MRKLQKKTKSTPTPKRRPGFVYTFKIGWFTALNVKLEEVAINEVVVRVPLRPNYKLEQMQSKQGVSSRKSDISSPIDREPRKKLIRRSGYKNSLSNRSSHKRTAEQSSVSSLVHDNTIVKPKRLRLSINDTKSQLQNVTKTYSKHSLHSRHVDTGARKKVRRSAGDVSKLSLSKQSPIKKPLKRSFNAKSVNCASDEELRYQKQEQEGKSFPNKQSSHNSSSNRYHSPVNGNKNSPSQPKSALKQLLKTTKSEVKGRKSGQKVTSPQPVESDEHFTNKLRQKLKQLVKIPSLGDSQTKLTVDFTKLSDLVMHMKLPSAQWRVTVLMNHDLSLVFEFTNKRSSRYVRFAESNPHCNIVVGGKSVILLGCPKTVDSLRDIEILLDIVDKLDLKDCMFLTSS